MADEFKYVIELNSTATGNGAAETVRNLGNVEQATLRLNNQADKARVQDWGFYDLDKEIRKTETTLGSFTSGVTRMEGPVRNNALGVLYFSQAFEDAQYGIRGVLNNIPQLIVALGGGVGLAGGISIAAVAASQLFTWISKIGEGAELTKEKIAEMAAAAAKVEGKQFEDALAAIDDNIARVESLKQKWDATKTAEDQYSISRLENAGKISEAEKLIDEWLGNQRDKYKEIDALAKAAQARRALEAKQALEAQNDELQKAREKQAQAEEYLQKRLDLERNTRIEIAALEEKYNSFKADKQRVLDMEAERQLQPQRPGQDPGIRFKFEPESIGKINAELEKFTARIAVLREKLTDLRGEGGKDGIGGEIGAAQNALNRANATVEDISKAVEINTQKLNDKLEASNIKAAVKTSLEKSDQLAKDLNQFAGTIIAGDARSQAALAELKEKVSDGKITADEVDAIRRDLVTLIGSIQAHVSKTSEDMNKVYELQKLFQSTSSLLISQTVPGMISQMKQLEDQLRIQSGRLDGIQNAARGQ